MAEMNQTRRGAASQNMHYETEVYREALRRKLCAFNVFLFMGVITQRFMHKMSACHTKSVGIESDSDYALFVAVLFQLK